MTIKLDAEVILKCSRCGFGISCDYEQDDRGRIIINVNPCGSCAYIANYTRSGVTLHETVEILKSAIESNKYGIRDLLKRL
jgi:hypothetical protein